VQLKNRILGHFLLAIYLLVVLHRGVVHQHSSDFSDNLPFDLSHQHSGFGEDHHDHKFHIGIFHFLGHLFDKIDHSNDHADEHIYVANKSLDKKNIENKTKANINSIGFGLFILEVEIEVDPAPDPPRVIGLQHQYNLSTSPLRGPPSLV
jgi:hypothetical protein